MPTTGTDTVADISNTDSALAISGWVQPNASAQCAVMMPNVPTTAVVPQSISAVMVAPTSGHPGKILARMT